MALNRTFRLVHLHPPSLASQRESCWRELDLPGGPNFSLRYEHTPLLVAVVDEAGLPIWAPTLFVARHSILSRGMTGDTPRTYGESLLPWLRYLAVSGRDITSADEERLQLYRARLMHARLATATANLRVAVAVQFHAWCQGNGYASPLSAYLVGRSGTDRSLAPRVIGRHPRVLSFEEVSRLMTLARTPYRLAFQWGLVAGLRRFEGRQLLDSMLPRPETLPFFNDGLASFRLMRKGGRELTVYAPVKLVEDTQWFFLTGRYKPLPSFEHHIFIGRTGRPLSRQALTKEFRRCGNLIGTDATLHHLRHTYAANVLAFLQRSNTEDGGQNSLKTLQVLMGHASMESTEVYLRASEVTSAAVVEALDYLYGAAP